jgi:predicted glycosyltransferase
VDGTAAAATKTEKSDNRKYTKMTRNTMVKTGTDVLDVLSEATRDAREADRVAKVQNFTGTIEMQGKQVSLLNYAGEDKAQFIAMMFPE